MKIVLKFIVPLLVLLSIVFLVIKPMIMQKEQEELPAEIVEDAAEK